MSRSMEIKVKRVAGLLIAMYETKVRRADGSLFFNQIVDLNEVVWA